MPTISVNDGCISEKVNPIYNLRGNVSEWTLEKNICVGGGWSDQRVIILKSDTFRLDSVNSLTGFRNVFEWKQKEKNAP